MRFRVSGKNEDTGSAVYVTVLADDNQDAVRQAMAAGVIAESVEFLPESHPTPTTERTSSGQIGRPSPNQKRSHREQTFSTAALVSIISVAAVTIVALVVVLTFWSGGDDPSAPNVKQSQQGDSVSYARPEITGAWKYQRSLDEVEAEFHKFRQTLAAAARSGRALTSEEQAVKKILSEMKEFRVVFRADGTGSEHMGAATTLHFKWAATDGRLEMLYANDGNPYTAEHTYTVSPDGSLEYKQAIWRRLE